MIHSTTLDGMSRLLSKHNSTKSSPYISIRSNRSANCNNDNLKISSNPLGILWSYCVLMKDSSSSHDNGSSNDPTLLFYVSSVTENK